MRVVGLLDWRMTNHTLHLQAIAKAAGIALDWSDMATLSTVVPLMTSVYPNGSADVNHFEPRRARSIAELLEHDCYIRLCHLREVMEDLAGERR